jgi:hypothetical protein
MVAMNSCTESCKLWITYRSVCVCVCTKRFLHFGWFVTQKIKSIPNFKNRNIYTIFKATMKWQICFQIHKIIIRFPESYPLDYHSWNEPEQVVYKNPKSNFLSLELWHTDNIRQPLINAKDVIKLQSKETGMGRWGGGLCSNSISLRRICLNYDQTAYFNIKNREYIFRIMK